MLTRDKTYLFYDLETTGVNPCFDQILQFAAVRTDQELNELERYEFLVKINPDTIPTAQAAITHHITIEQANTGISEYEAVKKIYQLVNTPNTMSVGYNTLNFDDKFLTDCQTEQAANRQKAMTPNQIDFKNKQEQ